MKSKGVERTAENYKSIEWYESIAEDYMYLTALVLGFPWKYKKELSENMFNKYNEYFDIKTVHDGRI